MLAADGEDTFPFLDQPEPTLRSGSSTISQCSLPASARSPRPAGR
jgi:hypothetical protein